ncbi:MAG TPA: hypothetical protein VF017_23510 [Thermoanaerobaculia bacterium]|nr:hypothetical protein [Thermoanaerobaculia bacterium]
MSAPDDKPTGGYLRFALVVLATAIGLGAVGWHAAARWGGLEIQAAVLAGIAASTFASLVGGVAVARAAARPARERVTGMLASMALRFVAALVAIGTVLAFGDFPAPPLLIGFAMGYLVLLAPDGWYARRALEGPSSRGG